MPDTLHPELKRALEGYRQRRHFNALEWVAGKTTALNCYMRDHGLTVCVTNVSGGVDSAVVLALCARAMGCAGSPIVKNVGVCQPNQSSDWALTRGMENIAACQATAVMVDQTHLHTALSGLVEDAVGIRAKDFASGQLRCYMRTPTIYYISQLFSQEGTPAIVMGTGNKDEDFYLGYFCKAGDGVVDLQLISDLHKSEVYLVAEALGVPESTRLAPASADLWEGHTDEDELGFPYDFVELFTGWYIEQNETTKIDFIEGLSYEARCQFKAYAKACEDVHRRNAHKLSGLVSL
ncbi:unnamed protein product [Phytomonas sp. Hart1]|nr:unnamed protein product [Phytomonas sp. Hart1]|eukprot:CCW70653.1 unnamed protein product [Phytomonas sp. isolate Hart1]